MTAQSHVMRARLHLLRELHAGSRSPGAPISVKDVGAELNLSHTPVREALARLVGEGVVTEAEGRNGFEVPRPGVGGYRQMIELSAILLDGGSSGERESVESVVAFDPLRALADPVVTIEALIGRVVAGSNNGYLARTVARLNLLLAPYRRVEPEIVPDWIVGMERLHLAVAVAVGHDHGTWHTYWRGTLRYAERIVDAAEGRRMNQDIFQL